MYSYKKGVEIFYIREFMLPRIQYIACISVVLCFAFSGFGQDRVFQNMSLRLGAGNSISIKQFSDERTSFNFPSSSFVNVQLSANLLQRNHASLFLGLEMQDLNFYPAFNEKVNLTYISLLAGRTSSVEVTQRLRVKYTGGLLLGTLTGVSSSVSGYKTYSGGPVKNMNLGFFNNLQLLLGKAKTDRRIDSGLGFDVVMNGIPVYNNASYPSYLKHNAFIQYGLSFNLRYNFKKRSAIR